MFNLLKQKIIECKCEHYYPYSTEVRPKQKKTAGDCSYQVPCVLYQRTCEKCGKTEQFWKSWMA